MATSPRHRLAALVAVTAIAFAACAGSTASESPSAEASATPEPTAAESAAPFAATSYPADGSSACGTKNPDGSDYAGIMGSIKAIDAQTVEFSLCQPDAAFLSKIAFASLGIQDADFLQSTGGGGDGLIRTPNGTGPFKFNSWTPDQEIVLDRNDAYWGGAAPYSKMVVQWSPEAAQRLNELQAGTVDGIDNPGPADFETIQSDSTLQFFPRTALNIMYIGMNNTQAPFDNEKVRQGVALGIDRQKIVDGFYPKGSSVAEYFTPCDIPGGCSGDPWWGFDPAAGKKLLQEAKFDFGKTYALSLRDVVRGYLPEPVTVATEIQRQLKENLGITVKIDVRDPTTYLSEESAGKLPVGFHLLGWGADYPDVTNFLDVHFGIGASDGFGTKFDDVTAPLKEASAIADPAKRAELYAQANNAIRQHVPMIPVAHGGSAVAFRADVEGAHSSPLGNEKISIMKPGDRDTFVWLQNGQPGGLYCADETDGEALRVCEQIFDSLYGYETGGTAPEPALAESCTANDDSTVWTCKLRSGVTFHDGATFDANDVVATYGVQWDGANPLHKGNSGLFEYWTYLFAAFINPAPAS